MGYKRQRKIYRLVFEDPEMKGLEVDCTGTTVGVLSELTGLADLAEFDTSITKEDLPLMKDALAKVNDLFDRFSTYLVAWNLEDEDGTPVPATLNGMKSQDPEFILDIIKAWIEAVGGVSGPKEQPSNDGKQFPEASIPMETLSPNQPTWFTPSSSSVPASGLGASLAH